MSPKCRRPLPVIGRRNRARLAPANIGTNVVRNPADPDNESGPGEDDPAPAVQCGPHDMDDTKPKSERSPPDEVPRAWLRGISHHSPLSLYRFGRRSCGAGWFRIWVISLLTRTTATLRQPTTKIRLNALESIGSETTSTMLSVTPMIPPATTKRLAQTKFGTVSAGVCRARSMGRIYRKFRD